MLLLAALQPLSPPLLCTIDSRLTTLSDDLEPPQASTTIDVTIRDLWSVEAPLGTVALGTGHVDQRFMLVRRSVIKARPDGGELTLQQDKAIGRFREQD